MIVIERNNKCRMMHFPDVISDPTTDVHPMPNQQVSIVSTQIYQFHGISI